MITMFFNPDGLHIIEMVCAGMSLLPGILALIEDDDEDWDDKLVENFPHLEN